MNSFLRQAIACMVKHEHKWNDALTVIEVTDKGMRRATNQDSSVVVLQGEEDAYQQRGHLFVVCDGMGAHAAGELASGDAVDHIPHHYLVYQSLSPPEALKKAIIKANEEIHRKGQENLDFHNMGTTCSSILLIPQGIICGHVGDSRVYRQRGNVIEQLTFDHSLQWELKAKGGDIENVPSNVITRSLGPNAEVEVDLEGPFPVKAGDCYLICSDGLSGEVTDSEIGAAMATLPPEQAAQFLLDLANLRGGPDNITIIIVQFKGPDFVTDVEGVEQIVIGKQTTPKKPLNPILLVASISLSLAGLLLLSINPIVGIAMAATGIVTGLVGFMLGRTGVESGETLERDYRFGSGPYTKNNCVPDATILQGLGQTANEIRQLAQEHPDKFNWAPFDEAFVESTEQMQGGQFVEAFRNIARAITFIMNEFRRG
ncbi:MAG: serine/threonine protein phosphatase [Planctomycetaceae bacterium]|nr:serine/threonine protein phosphatase [Planctomycetaceae bacterium]